jgi:predicted ATPase/DNA-binding SARP family transcriptional activator
VEFRVLGPLEVLGEHGEPVALGGARPRRLLGVLLLHANRPVATDRLIDAVWADSPPPSARGALQVHVHALRKALGTDRIVTRAPGYLVRVDEGELDADRFERLVDAGSFAEALGLWRGPALADLASEDFARADAARLEEARLSAHEARIAAELEAGRHDAVVPELDALVTAHPHRERLRAQQMLALYRAARQADALAAFRDARSALDELGLEPSAELRRLEQRILQQDPDLAPSAAVPREAGPGGLPVERTPLVGRELEVAAVRALLGRPETRLVTLTGPGGTGKTRLAIAAAEASERALFVDLSAVADPELVLPTVARALGADEAPGRGELETVLTALGYESGLLVLDNFEQVLDAAGDVAGLVDSAPALRVLVTSRSPLRVGAEHVYAVPPLPVPGPGDETAATIERIGSVRLYTDRARATLPEFALTDENAAAVARVCRALDGLPLALELAAARVRTLGPAGTADRLGQRLSLLSRGARDLPPRQRSLRATLDWSVQLLEDDARGLLAALGAFSGGASLDALESVVDAGVDVPGALEDLLDAALVTRSGSVAEPRFVTLETVREYAGELLAASGAEREARDRHLDWCLALVEGDTLPRHRIMDAPWLDLVELEHDNIRAAFAHAESTGDVERELRLAAAMRYFWRVRGYVEEGRRRLERGVELSPAADGELRARTIGEAGVMAFAAGDHTRSRALWLEALPLFEQLEDRREVGRALMEIGATWHAEGDLNRAIEYYEPAREVLVEVDANATGVVLANLGAVYHALGELDRAEAATAEALALAERIDDEDGIAISSLNLSAIDIERGDLRAAARHVAVAIDRALRLAYREVTAYALGIAGVIAVRIGRPEDAAVLGGAFVALFREIGAEPQPEEAERHAAMLAEAARQVDVEAALERGRSLTTDEAVALARDVLAGV